MGCAQSVDDTDAKTSSNKARESPAKVTTSKVTDGINIIC